MHPNQKQLEALLDIYKKAFDSTGKFLTDEDTAHIRLRLEKHLEPAIGFLNSLTGKEQPTAPAEHVPLTKMFGKTIGGNQADKIAAGGNVKQEHAKEKEKEDEGSGEQKLSPEEEELLKAVNELFPIFRTIETPAILDKYSELEIRAVGKRAGLPVTENLPKKVDAKFVDTIKEAMDQADKIAAGGNVKAK